MIAVCSTDKGSRIDIPKWVEKAGHRLVGVDDARRLRRDRRREAPLSGRMPTMQRILILGGGVGGTLVANLVSRKLKTRHRRRRRSSVTVVDEPGDHVYQPGFMYIAMGGERAEQPVSARSDRCSTTASSSSSARSRGSTRPRRRSSLERRRATLAVRLARPGHRLAHRARGDRALRHRRRTTSTPPRRRRTAARRRSTPSPAAGSSSASPGCPTSARRRRSRSRS